MKYAIALAITLLVIYTLTHRHSMWDSLFYGEPAKVEDDLQRLNGEL
jgi:hypothetical protein